MSGDAGETERGHFLPVRKRDLLDAILADPNLARGADPDGLREVNRLIASIFHFELYEKLEALKDTYFHFNPDIRAPDIDPAEREKAFAVLEGVLAETLRAANFSEVSQKEIERAHAEHALVPVKVRVLTDDFRVIRFFRRGRRLRHAEVRQFLGLRKKKIAFEQFDHVVLFAAYKSASEIAKRRRRAEPEDSVRYVAPGSVLIKYFRDVPAQDLNMLYPNVRIVMSHVDKLMLGVPAIVGGIPLMLNLIPALTIIFVVLGAYLGFTGTVEDSDVKKALAALSGLVAIGGFMMRQWVKFERQSLVYQKQLTENVYFRNVNNNAGTFDYLIGVAEDQETKEAFLAYAFLRAADQPLEKLELDRRIEHWLEERFGLHLDFEVHDALGKLERLGLLTCEGTRCGAVGWEDALLRLDRIWDDFFPYNRR